MDFTSFNHFSEILHLFMKLPLRDLGQLPLPETAGTLAGARRPARRRLNGGMAEGDKGTTMLSAEVRTHEGAALLPTMTGTWPATRVAPARRSARPRARKEG